MLRCLRSTAFSFHDLMQTRIKSNYHGVVLINFYANPFLSASCITSSGSHDCRPPSVFLLSFIIPVFSGDHLPVLSAIFFYLCPSPFLCISSLELPFFHVTRGESFSPPRPALRINVFNAIWMGVLWMNTTGNRLVLFAQGENESVLMGERRALSWRSNGSRDDHSVRLCGCDYLTCFCMRVLAQMRSATVCRFTPCYSSVRLL